MKKTNFRKVLSFIVCAVLIAAMALSTIACSVKKNTPAAADNTAIQSESNVLGQGAVQFSFTVTDPEGKETVFTVNTDEATVGEALVEVGLIDGEVGEYGLYVKTVNGLTLDWEKDGKYWAFYINGEYAMSGVDSTDVTAGDSYSFKAE